MDPPRGININGDTTPWNVYGSIR